MPSVHDVDIVQSRMFGQIRNVGFFNDTEQVISSGNVTINTSHPITQIVVVHSDVIDGLEITYNKTVNSQGTPISHGTSKEATDKKLKTSKITVEKGEVITGISGWYGVPEDTRMGVRVQQLTFEIRNTATKHSRFAGPFGSKTSNANSFNFSATGNFVAFGGYAVETNGSIGELTNGEEGGLYALSFHDVYLKDEEHKDAEDITYGRYHIKNRVNSSQILAPNLDNSYLYVLNPPIDNTFPEEQYIWTVKKVTSGYEIVNKLHNSRYIQPQGDVAYPTVSTSESKVRIVPVPNEANWYFIVCDEEDPPAVLVNPYQSGQQYGYTYIKMSTMDHLNSSQMWHFVPA